MPDREGAKLDEDKGSAHSAFFNALRGEERCVEEHCWAFDLVKVSTEADTDMQKLIGDIGR